ncbi:uncharacterized protein LOC132085604 [Ammospiza nelsoni]|uniref:uncharacterized protein LOC132085604 n=1 Tax=Ammospiza nelsoni TaxID=2857394 RepID=UPI00286ABDBB|nr:uncharacterized protein LOC132085604 [Ammospiza nelsoni]
MLLVSPRCLDPDLEDFTRELQTTLYRTDDSWRCCNVTSNDDDPVTFLSKALAAYKYTPWITLDDVTMVVSKWHRSMSVLLNRSAQLAWAATRALQHLLKGSHQGGHCHRPGQGAAGHGCPLWNSSGKHGGAGSGREEGANVVARPEPWVRREAMVAASEATRAMVRQWVEAALGLLERLVAACDEATTFPWELQHRVGDIKVALKGTNELSPDVPKGLVAKVAVAEWLWEANACLAKDHLLGTLDDIITFYFDGGPASPSVCEVAKRCQRVIKDISRFLQPWSVPRASPLGPQ